MVESLFDLIELARTGSSSSTDFEILLSIYQIYNEKITDLLESVSETNKKELEVTLEFSDETGTQTRHIKNLSEHLIAGPHDTQSFLQRADRLRRIEACQEQDKEIHLRAHFVVALTLMKKSRGNKKTKVSRCQLVELASSEQAVENEVVEAKNKQRSKVRKSITQGFNNMSVRILKHALKQGIEPRDTLQKCMDITMEGEDSIVIFVCCVAPTIELFQVSTLISNHFL